MKIAENHGKMVKNTANFCENRQNHGKDTASNHGPEDHYTVYKLNSTSGTDDHRYNLHAVQGFHL